MLDKMTCEDRGVLKFVTAAFVVCRSGKHAPMILDSLIMKSTSQWLDQWVERSKRSPHAWTFGSSRASSTMNVAFPKGVC